MDIVYLKLVTGEELFADLISKDGDILMLDNVMIMETIHSSQDVKYMFMSRYTQYCDNHSIVIDRSNVVFMNEASEIIKKHYLISVEYADVISDERFTQGILDAQKYLSTLIRASKSKFDNDSTTKH
jgi:hypothetical protein